MFVEPQIEVQARFAKLGEQSGKIGVPPEPAIPAACPHAVGQLR